MPSLFFIYLCRFKKNIVALELEEEEIDLTISSNPENSSLKTSAITVSTYGNIVCSLEEFSDYLPTGFLAILIEFAKEIGYFRPFKEHLEIDMKEVKYTIMQKIQTLMFSVAVGCNYIKDINHKLCPYSAGASLLGMERFPDQSQINRFLRRMTAKDVSDLLLCFDLLLKEYGLFQNKGKVDINIDSTGLAVEGKTYEFKAKGYFPNQRGKEGYQLTLCTTNEKLSEILTFFLDPGNISLRARLFDCIYGAAEVFGSVERIGIIRADAIFGTGPNIESLLEQEFSFLIKGLSSLTASHLAKDLVFEDWYWVNSTTLAAELGKIPITNCKYPVRTILTHQLNAKGKWVYRHTYTSVPQKEMDCVEAFSSYNQREHIESVIKSDKYGLHIDNLRTTKFWGIWAFLVLAFATHNLLSIFRKKVLSPAGLEDLGIREITQKLMDIPAKIEKKRNKICLAFPQHHHYSRIFVEELHHFHNRSP